MIGARKAGQELVGEGRAYSSPAVRLATQCYRGCSSWETSPTFSRTRTSVSLVRPPAPRDNRTARTEHRETIQHETLRMGFGLLTLLLLNVAAATPQKISDEAAVRATVTDYIEGYYTSDASRMEKSLHPHYLKHTISGSDGQLRMTEKAGLQMVQDVRSVGPTNLSEKKDQITVLDIAGDMASAKLVTAHWVDYMTLSKWNGEWKIVSVVLREND